MPAKPAALLWLLMLCSCRPPLERIEAVIGGQAFRLEVARRDEDRQRGLMHRRSLAPREGMLFVFETEQRLNFWMKNTRIPLSLAFLDSDGRILELVDLKPLSLRVVTSRQASRYALELLQGAFRELGVRPGDTVILPAGFR